MITRNKARNRERGRKEDGEVPKKTTDSSVNRTTTTTMPRTSNREQVNQKVISEIEKAHNQKKDGQI